MRLEGLFGSCVPGGACDRNCRRTLLFLWGLPRSVPARFSSVSFSVLIQPSAWVGTSLALSIRQQSWGKGGGIPFFTTSSCSQEGAPLLPLCLVPSSRPSPGCKAPAFWGGGRAVAWPEEQRKDCWRSMHCCPTGLPWKLVLQTLLLLMVSVGWNLAPGTGRALSLLRRTAAVC